MKKDSIAITVTSIILIIYCALAAIPNMSYALIVFLFISLHILLVWMIFRILKQPTKVEDTFEEKFYQDKDIPR